MDLRTQMNFELSVMDICENAKCKDADDFSRLAKEMHESIENAICDMCMDLKIEDYTPSY